MIWLDVPYSEKDEAKKLGARWNPKERRWYAAAMTPSLQRWAPSTQLSLPDPLVLVGEDRTVPPKLAVKLIPLTCWFTNAKTCLQPSHWRQLHYAVLKRSSSLCEYCGSRVPGNTHDVREVWDYDFPAHAQVLRRLVTVCEECRDVIHFGYGQMRGNSKVPIMHLAQIGGISVSQAQTQVDEAYADWVDRSHYNWALDLSLLSDNLIPLTSIPSALSRKVVAYKRAGIKETPEDFFREMFGERDPGRADRIRAKK